MEKGIKKKGTGEEKGGKNKGLERIAEGDVWKENRVKRGGEVEVKLKGRKISKLVGE